MTTSVIDGDCDWFAVDSVGQLALFTSAGAPYVPEFYWPNPKLLRDLVKKAELMPVSCRHEFVGERQAGCDYSSWTHAADRGLYGYDYDLHTDTGYRLITIPGQPVRVGDASAAWARDLPFFNGVFGRDAALIPSSPILKWIPR
jgi:hypothetical protein